MNNDDDDDDSIETLCLEERVGYRHTDQLDTHQTNV